MSLAEDAFADITEPFTGKKASEEARKRAEEDALKSRRDAAAARVFAETEGAGQGTVGEVVLGTVDEEEDDTVLGEQVFKL